MKKTLLKIASIFAFASILFPNSAYAINLFTPWIWATSTPALYPIVYTKTGIGTTSPWGQFSIGVFNLAVTSPSFVIASSSSGSASTTQFIVMNGNVGIGTSSPGTTLSVQGTGLIADFLTASKFLATSTSATSTFQGTILASTGGNVGIGTTTPSAILTFNESTASNGGLRFGSDMSFYREDNRTLSIDSTDSSSRSILHLRNGGTTKAEVYIDSAQMIIGSSANLPLRLRTNSIERMTLDTSGNVGVGSSTPGTLLSVGNTQGINFTTGTTTHNTTGGINLANGGCYAISGTCVGGSAAGGSYSAFNWEYHILGGGATAALGTSSNLLAMTVGQKLTVVANCGKTNVGGGSEVDLSIHTSQGTTTIGETVSANTANSNSVNVNGMYTATTSVTARVSLQNGGSEYTTDNCTSWFGMTGTISSN